jgi:DNA-directed RNA polymerase specialized sigma subunit
MSVQKKAYTSKLYREKTGAKASQQLLDLRRSQLDVYSKITNALKTSPKTVPEIAQETGMDTKTVFWYLSTYYKYNIVSVVEKTEDGFYRYAMKPKEK